MDFVMTGLPPLIVLCFTVLYRYFVFHTLKVGGNPASSESISTIFPTAFAHVLSLCHILVILAILQTLHQQKDYNSLKAQMMVSIF